MNCFALLADSDNVDKEEQKIAKAILESARLLCPPTRHHTQLWISDKRLDLVAERKKGELVDLERYRLLNQEVCRMMKRDRKAYWNQVAEDLEVASSRHDYPTLYCSLRRLSSKSKSTNDKIKKADATFVRSVTEHLHCWKEFFDGLYNNDMLQGRTEVPPEIDPPPPHAPMSDAEPTIEEVKHAVHACYLCQK